MTFIAGGIGIRDVEMRGVVVKYGSNTILNGIDLNVEQGELLTLLGPSGCGKTTTLNLIAGFVEADEGDLYIKGKRMNKVPPYKRDLGMVFQSYSLFPHMTVYENLNFGLSLHKVGKEERAKRMRDVLDLVKMSGLENRYPRELSGGQRQRVAIARALVVRPKLLLLDEPLSNLDAALRQELRSEIKRLQKDLGVTTIFVTHDQEEALSMSTRIVVMNKGNVEQVGTPTEIYQHPKSEFVFQFVGRSNLLHGRIHSVEQRLYKVQLQTGWEIPLEKESLLESDSTYVVGDEVRLYIRPEKVQISSIYDSGDSNDWHSATIIQMNYLGYSWEIEVSLLGQSMRIVSSTVDPSWSAGSEVMVGWKPSDMKLKK